MHDKSSGPAPLHPNLVVSDAPEGVLIYDRDTYHIHHLNHLAADVWKSWDGQASADDVAQRVSQLLGEIISSETVNIAVADLEAAGLLGNIPGTHAVQGRQSRRTFLRRATATGAAVPVVISMSAPTAANAQTAEEPCVPDGQPRGNDRCCNGEVCFIDGVAWCRRCTCGGRCEAPCSCAQDNTCLCPG